MVGYVDEELMIALHHSSPPFTKTTEVTYLLTFKTKKR